MISFYIISKRFFLKRKGLSDARVLSLNKKEYGFAVHLLERFILFFGLTVGVSKNAPGEKLSRFLRMKGGGGLGHTLIIIKWT